MECATSSAYNPSIHLFCSAPELWNLPTCRHASWYGSPTRPFQGSCLPELHLNLSYSLYSRTENCIPSHETRRPINSLDWIVGTSSVYWIAEHACTMNLCTYLVSRGILMNHGKPSATWYSGACLWQIMSMHMQAYFVQPSKVCNFSWFQSSTYG